MGPKPSSPSAVGSSEESAARARMAESQLRYNDSFSSPQRVMKKETHHSRRVVASTSGMRASVNIRPSRNSMM